MFVLRVRSGVNLTGRRTRNACSPVENPTGNKREDRRIDIRKTRPTRPKLGQGAHGENKYTYLLKYVPFGPISLATGCQLCPMSRTMRQTQSLRLVCLHTPSALDVCLHSTLAGAMHVEGLFLLTLGREHGHLRGLPPRDVQFSRAPLSTPLP